MKLREYQFKDCNLLTELFYNTVHTVNAKDYSKDQLDAWATGNIDINSWNNAFLEHTTLIAEIDGIIVGFGDMDNQGYLDRLYVHRDYQGRGIATVITNELERRLIACGVFCFSTHASITAKPFFEKRGYRVTCKNNVVCNNIALTNYTMEKNPKA